MLDPETLDYILNSLGVHKELQESIIREISRKIVMGGLTPADALTETVVYQAEILQKSGVVYEDAVKIIAEKSDALYYDMMVAFDSAEVEIFNYDDEILLHNGKEPETVKNISPAMRQLWEAAFNKAFTEANNLTKTLASVFQNVFISSCDLAHMQIASGAFSYSQAIANAIKEAAKQCLKVVYPSGATASTDYAVRRAVLTSINQSAGQIMSMRAAELNHDLMQTTAHYGARPEHAEWQGQVVSMSGAAGYLSAADIGYGSVTGIFGANCNHGWYMYFGHSAYTPEQLRDMKDKTVTYEDKEMSVYEARQKQRGYERAIRKTKAELVAYDEALKHLPLEEQTALKFQFQNASVRLKGQEAKLADFCKQTGLKRDTFREQMFAAETESAIKAWSKSTSSKAVWANRKAFVEKGITGKRKFNTIENIVDMEYIHSEEYKQKFTLLPYNKNVRQSVYMQAKSILEHRNGTYFEDLCLIDKSSGKVLSVSSGRKENEVRYSTKANQMVAQNPNSLIALHNHGTNIPPTGSDLVSAGRRKYDSGIIVCHNGEVYMYKSGNIPFSSKTFGDMVDNYKDKGYNEVNAVRLTLDYHTQHYNIEWRKI